MQYIVLHPAVAQFVTRLCMTYREQGSDLDTLQADVECDKSVPVPNLVTRVCLENKVCIVASPVYTDIHVYESKPIHIVASDHYVDI